jgi:hypothetical protein
MDRFTSPMSRHKDVLSIHLLLSFKNGLFYVCGVVQSPLLRWPRFSYGGYAQIGSVYMRNRIVRQLYCDLVYKSFAKPVTKTGLLRVILHYLNPINPPQRHIQIGVLPCCELFLYKYYILCYNWSFGCCNLIGNEVLQKTRKFYLILPACVSPNRRRLRCCRRCRQVGASRAPVGRCRQVGASRAPVGRCPLPRSLSGAHPLLL